MKTPHTTRLVTATLLIAPCGINCGICAAFLRSRNPCPGCRVDDPRKPRTRTSCRIKACALRRGTFCRGCADYPCARLRHLDRRYRTKYGVSVLDNLHRIAAAGVRRFVAAEQVKWACTGCGATVCMHRPACLACGKPRAAHQLIAAGDGRPST